MKECVKIVAVSLLLFFTMLHRTRSQPGGSVLVRLDHLQNPENTDKAGKCCGRRLLGRCQPCDYQLSIWVTCDARTTTSECLYGAGKTRVFHNKSEIFFLQDLGNGLSNPIESNFTSFQGNLGIKILTSNANGSEIHSYSFHQSVHPTTYDKKKWINMTLSASTHNTSIKLSYNIHCNKHYYSPSCSVGCLPGANYKCDENSGKKLCINGYVGPNCTCKPAGHQYNCDATGKRICYRPWFGVNCDVKCQEINNGQGGYSCDSKTGAKICLSGWHGPECTNTIPQVFSSLFLTPQNSSSIFLTSTQQLSSTTAASKVMRPLSTRRKSNTLLTTKNSINRLTSKKLILSPKITATTSMTSSSQMPSPLTSPPWTSSSLTSSSLTSSPLTFPSTKTSLAMPSFTRPVPIISLMTSPTMTSNLMTSLSTMSHLLPSQAYSVVTEHRSLNSKHASLIIRNSTRKPQKFSKIIVTTSNGVIGSSASSHIDAINITKKSFAGIATSLTATSESKGYHAKPTNQENNEHNTPTPPVTTFKPKRKDASKGEDLWWLLILPLILATLLTITGIAVFKKNRKCREISPHYEATMQQFKVKPKENGGNHESDKEHTDDTNNNEKEPYQQKDLEAIWKVMSTCHE